MFMENKLNLNQILNQFIIVIGLAQIYNITKGLVITDKPLLVGRGGFEPPKS